MAKNPKRVVEAFTAAGAAAGALHLREFTAGTLLLMQKVDCPLLDEATGKKGRRPLSDMDVMRLVFLLAKPAAESFALLARGLAEFDAAVVEFADTVAIRDLPAIGAQINALYARAMSTAPAGGGADGKKRPAHSATSPSGATGSAGS